MEKWPTNFLKIFHMKVVRCLNRLTRVMSTSGDFQIVGQVLEPPNISGPALEMEI